MQCKAWRAAQAERLRKRHNAAMRRPGHLPERFAPESPLDSVALLANRQRLFDASRALPATILVRTRALLLMK